MSRSWSCRCQWCWHSLPPWRRGDSNRTRARSRGCRPQTREKGKAVKERIKQMHHDSITAEDRSLCCPFCVEYDLEPSGPNSAGCQSCGIQLSGALLETLRQISELSDLANPPACECGHPEMRCLPDGGAYWVYWCPSCSSEVLPLSRFPLSGVSERLLATPEASGALR